MYSLEDLLQANPPNFQNRGTNPKNLNFFDIDQKYFLPNMPKSGVGRNEILEISLKSQFGRIHSYEKAPKVIFL